MSDQKSVAELMVEYGYTFKGSCHCDGYETWKWKKGVIEVKWRKYKAQFTILQGRATVKGWTKIVELGESIKKLHADVAVQK